MFEILTGTGLAVAAGLNAYIPLLILGLAGRFIEVVQLPAAWSWLSHDWVLVILGVLLVVEVVADKIPVVDSINDWIQTVVRPAAGGIAFGTGSTSQTSGVTDPAVFFSSNAWVPIAVGVLLALAIHATKTVVRPAMNIATAGAAAPLVSTIEDVSSVILSVLALLLPLLVIAALGGLLMGFVALLRRSRRRRAESRAIRI